MTQRNSQHAFAITPHNTQPFPRRSRWLYVGGAGNVAAVFPDGGVVTFVGLPAGALLPIELIRVNATGTTATNLVGLG